MAILKCKMCGGDIQVTDDTYGVCISCGTTMTLQDAADGANGANEDTPKASNAASTTMAAPSVESLMKRGWLLLEDSDWKQAAKYFNKVLNINPEYAPAYIGKLCAELNVTSEDALDGYELLRISRFVLFLFKNYFYTLHYEYYLVFLNNAIDFFVTLVGKCELSPV